MASGAGGGTRTPTTLGHRNLNPARLPVPPRPQAARSSVRAAVTHWARSIAACGARASEKTRRSARRPASVPDIDRQRDGEDAAGEERTPLRGRALRSMTRVDRRQPDKPERQRADPETTGFFAWERTPRRSPPRCETPWDLGQSAQERRHGSAVPKSDGRPGERDAAAFSGAASPRVSGRGGPRGCGPAAIRRQRRWR